jgi:hypothetical protein
MTEFLDCPPYGWFAFEVVEARKWDWIALMVDVDLDDFTERHRPARSCWVRIPGKHRNYDAAWDALKGMMATRH